MLNTLIKRMFGSRNERTLKRMEKAVAAINNLEHYVKNLTNQELAEKTADFRKRYAEGASLETLLPEVFAVGREAASRVLGLRHFDVQLIGGMVLHEGNIAEMRTGEGKTLVATLPAYLNALTGKGVHIVTVNDYLAKRDSQWMKPIYDFLGLTVGVIHSDMSQTEKKLAYQSDIVYGTNNEFGFDYLRDNMAFGIEDKVQRELNFAIVDEVDSILIDEARTPLIISGMAEDSSELYRKVDELIPHLSVHIDGKEGDYTVDEKQKQAHLTETGHQRIEDLLIKAQLLAPGESLYHANNIILMHHINAALKAYVIFHKDVDYIVKDNQVVIVDEHTGRTMPGRRWSEGLHQAVEAKEKVAIQNENQTLASITFQNYFRLYNKLSGMTGTADTEAYEFQQIYNLEVVVIPTNKPMLRQDQADLVYLTLADKHQGIIEDIKGCITRNQPVLVGTASIESSELLSQLLTKAQIKHQVLNAKFHEKEAQIIAEAGRPKAVTIATNMAGRGTDIILGGNLKAELQAMGEMSDQKRQAITADWQVRNNSVLQAGGLRIIGSERHESRRIDNQLRGRSGRQGDAGSSQFYLSLDDNLLRIFAPERISALIRGTQSSNEPLSHKFLDKTIQRAQRRLEGYHFDIRKQLLEYDNVANEQRKVIYTQRATLMQVKDSKEIVTNMRKEVLSNLVDAYLPPQSLEDQWDLAGLTQALADDFNIKFNLIQWIDEDHGIQSEQVLEKIEHLIEEKYHQKQVELDREALVNLEKSIILQTLDSHWREHLAAMDYLRQGIHLRGYAQKDPKQEYKKEAFALFTSMLKELKYEIIRLLTVIEIQNPEEFQSLENNHGLNNIHNLSFIHNDAGADKQNSDNSNVKAFKNIDKKIGRNEVCPCGSGKKFKNCHGMIA